MTPRDADPAGGPDVSVIVTTYRRPRHLARVLESLGRQRLPAGGLEVVVSDDGSDDETPDVVDRAARVLPFPVRFVTAPRDGFRLAAARNRAARLATGSYYLFLDGDCVVPPHHVAAHLARRRGGLALLGYCARLPEAVSEQILADGLDGVDLEAVVPPDERAALDSRRRKAWWHAALRHPSKPRLAGGDFGIWRRDFEAVNGFDERFVGWGQEDDDLGLRLRTAGVRLASVLDATRSLHLWHPADPTAPGRWRDGPNVAYFERPGRLVRCRNGLVRRAAADLRWGLPADLPATPLGRDCRTLLATAAADGCAPVEIDLVVRPGRGTFVREAECRLVVTTDAAAVEPALRAAADRVAVIDSTTSADRRGALAAVLDQTG